MAETCIESYLNYNCDNNILYAKFLKIYIKSIPLKHIANLIF